MPEDLMYTISILVYDRPLECYIDNTKLCCKNWQDEFHYKSFPINQDQHKLIIEEQKWCESGFWMLLFLPFSLLVSIFMFFKDRNIFVDGKRPYKERLVLSLNVYSNVNITIDSTPSLRDCRPLLNIEPSDCPPTGAGRIISSEYEIVKCSRKGVLVWILSQIMWTGIFCVALFLTHFILVKILSIVIFTVVSAFILHSGWQRQ